MIDLLLSAALAAKPPPPHPKHPRRDDMTQTDPRIKAAAHVAALKLKSLTSDYEAQKEAIYQEYRREAAAFQKGKGSADELETPSADPDQTTNFQS
jgi:hypothetical protein